MLFVDKTIKNVIYLLNEGPIWLHSEMLTGKAAGQKSARAGKAIKKDSDALLEDTKKNLSALLAPINVEMERDIPEKAPISPEAQGGGSARNYDSPPASRKRAAEKSPAKDSPNTN